MDLSLISTTHNMNKYFVFSNPKMIGTLTLSWIDANPLNLGWQSMDFREG